MKAPAEAATTGNAPGGTETIIFKIEIFYTTNNSFINISEHNTQQKVIIIK